MDPVVQYQIGKVDYYCGVNAPQIMLRLSHFEFTKGDSSIRIEGEDGANLIELYLTKNAFVNMTGEDWDGTKEGIEKFKKKLEGKVFVLDFGMKKS